MRPKRWPTRFAVVVLLVAVIIAAAGVGVAAWGSLALVSARSAGALAEESLVEAEAALAVAKDEAHARSAANRKREAEQRAIEEAEAFVRDREQQLAAQGFQPAGSGVWFQFAPADAFYCGDWYCAGVWLVAAEGCPTALYIEAAIMNGDTQVGITSEQTTSVPEWGDAAVIFDDNTGNGNGFRITKVDCT